MNFVSERGDVRRLAVVCATIALAIVALLGLAARADAAETLYWNNYESGSVAFANIDGSGGGALDATGVTIDSPEGMAYDTLTNRLYLVSESGGDKGEIVVFDLGARGATVFSAPGAPVDSPEGMALDPTGRTLYWTNDGATPTIAWAKLDGSAGGVLDTTGATVDSPNRIAFDPATRRVYWVNDPAGPDVIGFANADNSGGGGDLTPTAAEPPGDLTGIAVDSAAGILYWLDNADGIVGTIPLSGGGPGGQLNMAGASLDEPYGLAVDPSANRAYWGNYGTGLTRAGAIGFTGLTGGGGGGISPISAPVDGAQDPLIIKSPTGSAAPAVTQNPNLRSELSCSTGQWAADLPGSFVYQAPRTFAYQWTLNGAAVPGATTAVHAANAAGRYACTVTATNHAGSATQTSAAVDVRASRLKLSTRRKAKADPGDLVAFQVRIVNQGDLQSKKARICVKLPKAAKDDLRRPKCKQLGKLSSQAKRTIRIRVKVKPGADAGAGKLTFQVKGTPGKAAKSKIIVR